MSMNDTDVSEMILRVFERPTRGVIGVVEDLLAACPKDGLRLEWQADQCLVFLTENGQDLSFPVSIRKSILRTILARVAALCNERTANSVSPYGGQGTFSLGTRANTFRVEMVNTTVEQKLELRPEADADNV